MKIKYVIKNNDNLKLLKDILKNNLFISNILLNKLKRTNSIFLNGYPLQFINCKVKENDIIILDFDNMNNIIYNDKNNIYYKEEKFLDKYKRFDFTLDILYEDDYLLIVNKPYNMQIHPSSTNYETTLSNAVATYLEKQNIYSIHIVTRLDKNTSGICIFAKNQYIQELFIRKKDNISLKKEYIAIVSGIIQKKHDFINKNIKRKSDSIILRKVDPNGDIAKTEYFLEKINLKDNYSIVRLILHTGRTHQIRVHMASIGHVILGDTLYANEYNIKDIDKLIKRQALHSYKISFYHPITHKNISLVADIPDDMKSLCIESNKKEYVKK